MPITRRAIKGMLIGVASIGVLGITAFLFLGQDEYKYLRHLHPHEEWERNPRVEKKFGFRPHVFHFKQDLRNISSELGMSQDDARKTEAYYAAKHPVEVNFESGGDPKLPSGKTARLVPSRKTGYKWSMYVDTDPTLRDRIYLWWQSVVGR